MNEFSHYANVPRESCIHCLYCTHGLPVQSVYQCMRALLLVQACALLTVFEKVLSELRHLSLSLLCALTPLRGKRLAFQLALSLNARALVEEHLVHVYWCH